MCIHYNEFIHYQLWYASANSKNTHLSKLFKNQSWFPWKELKNFQPRLLPTKNSVGVCQKNDFDMKYAIDHTNTWIRNY